MIKYLVELVIMSSVLILAYILAWRMWDFIDFFLEVLVNAGLI